MSGLNHKTYLDYGETGIHITVTIVDADEDIVTLTGKTVQFIVWKGSTRIIDQLMTNEDQTTNNGQATYVTTLLDSTNNRPGSYKWKYVCTDIATGEVFEGPKSAGGVGGDFILRKAG